MERPLLPQSPVPPALPIAASQRAYDRLTLLHSSALSILTTLSIAFTVCNLEDVKYRSVNGTEPSFSALDNPYLLSMWFVNLLTVLTLLSLFQHDAKNVYDRVESRSMLERLFTLTVEIAITLMSPLRPTVILRSDNPVFSGHALVSLFVFLRIYNYLRLLRDLDPLHAHRTKIRASMYKAHLMPPRFDWLFTVKRLVHNAGVTVSLVLFLAMLFIFSYAMFTIERYQDEMICNSLSNEDCWDDYWLVVWFCASTLTTVGYGDMVPSTGTGRTMSIIMCVFGVILLGFMFAAVSKSLNMSEKATHAMQIYHSEQCLRNEEKAAARVLQRWARQRSTSGNGGGVKAGARSGRIASISSTAILKRRRASRRAVLATADATSDKSRLRHIEQMLERVLDRLDNGGVGDKSIGEDKYAGAVG